MVRQEAQSLLRHTCTPCTQSAHSTESKNSAQVTAHTSGWPRRQHSGRWVHDGRPQHAQTSGSGGHSDFTPSGFREQGLKVRLVL